VAAGEAKVQLLHGVPGVEADVYIDGEAIAAEFGSGSVAGPIELDAGTHEIELFAATPSLPASSEDRTDEPVATSSIEVGAEPASLVAHLDEDGEVALSVFDEDLRPLDPGTSRVTVRNLMATGTVDASIDGEAVGPLKPGQETVVEVDAGSILVEFQGDDGAIMTSTTLSVPDGELASLSAIGSPADDTAEIVVQRYSGLSTAPSGVPTGDSGLLGSGDSSAGIRLVSGLIVVMLAGGAVLALLRRRALS
jgi:hypothetical protein